MVAILEKGEFNTDFHPMVDFIAASPLRYALTIKPTVFVSHIRQFWSTARIETTDEGTHILATVDGIQRTVSEASLRHNLKLRDEDGIVSIPDTELFENLTLMGYNISQNQKFTFQKGQFSHQWKYLIHTIMQCLSPKSTGFNEFSSNIATALVCLATNRTYNFSKMIFDGMVKNVNNKFWSTARIETTNEGTYILAAVDGIQRTVSEASLRRNLKLTDEDGIVSIPDTELFENLTLMGVLQNFISKDNSISMRNRLFMHIVQDDSIFWSLRFVSKTKEYQVYGALIHAGMTNSKMLNSTAYKTYLAFATGAVTPKKARKFKKHASPSKKTALFVVEDPVEKLVKKPAARRQSIGVQIKDTPGVSVSKKKAPTKAERSKGMEMLSEAALVKEAQLKKAIKQRKRETNIHQAGGLSEKAGLEPRVPDEQKRKPTDKSEGTGLISRVLDVSKLDFFENDEENECINKEMYDDVNVELKDAEPANKGKGDEEMTDADKVDYENENVNQEVAGDQVNDDAQATVTAMLATQKTEVPLQRSFISSDYATKILNFDNIPPAETKIISLMDIKSEVPTVVKEYLETSLDDTLPKKSAADIHKIKMEQASKHQETKHTITSSNTAKLQEFDQKRTLFEIMTKTKSFNKNIIHKALYHALMEYIREDEEPMDKGVRDMLKKRKLDNTDRDEGPPAEPDYGLKRKKTSKDTEPSKKDLREDIGNIDEPLVVKADPKDWFKKSERPPPPDPEWNECKTVDSKPTQKWLSDLAKAEKSSKTFVNLMSTSIDFSAFAMNHL
nr:hypothetical protein [Tanacetum cinerariifolium]